MAQKEWYLLECYLMDACRGMEAIINNGKLEGFTKEEEDGVQVQATHQETVRMVREGV